jgi:REP element-mobilizing transposase RayT
MENFITQEQKKISHSSHKLHALGLILFINQTPQLFQSNPVFKSQILPKIQEIIMTIISNYNRLYTSNKTPKTSFRDSIQIISINLSQYTLELQFYYRPMIDLYKLVDEIKTTIEKIDNIECSRQYLFLSRNNFAPSLLFKEYFESLGLTQDISFLPQEITLSPRTDSLFASPSKTNAKFTHLLRFAIIIPFHKSKKILSYDNASILVLKFFKVDDDHPAGKKSKYALIHYKYNNNFLFLEISLSPLMNLSNFINAFKMALSKRILNILFPNKKERESIWDDQYFAITIEGETDKNIQDFINTSI